MSEELKPCPLCSRPASKDFQDAWCDFPDCSLYRHYIPIPRWQKRPVEQQQAKRITELEQRAQRIWDGCEFGYIVGDDYKECGACGALQIEGTINHEDGCIQAIVEPMLPKSRG